MPEPVADIVRRLTDSTLRPFFVNVGANDGLTGDPLGRLVLDDQRWHGLLIEPVPAIAARLRNTFPPDRFDINAIAISDSPGVRPFFVVDDSAADQIPDLPPWWNQLGSFDRQHIVKHLGGILAPFIVRIDVESHRLCDVLRQRHIDHIDVLQIDAEGSDLDVLAGLDFDAVTPSIVIVEQSHLSPRDRARLAGLLSRHHYRLSNRGRDWLAINKKAPPPGC